MTFGMRWMGIEEPEMKVETTQWIKVGTSSEGNFDNLSSSFDLPNAINSSPSLYIPALSSPTLETSFLDSACCGKWLLNAQDVCFEGGWRERIALSSMIASPMMQCKFAMTLIRSSFIRYSLIFFLIPIAILICKSARFSGMVACILYKCLPFPSSFLRSVYSFLQIESVERFLLRILDPQARSDSKASFWLTSDRIPYISPYCVHRRWQWRLRAMGNLWCKLRQIRPSPDPETCPTARTQTQSCIVCRDNFGLWYWDWVLEKGYVDWLDYIKVHSHGGVKYVDPILSYQVGHTSFR